jgi:hypothetical protein
MRVSLRAGRALPDSPLLFKVIFEITMPYTWPATELDSADALLGLMGSFWAETYQGNDLVASLLQARARLAEQTYLDFLDLVAAMSRFSVPVFHKRNWTLLTLRQSQMNMADANLARFDGTYKFDGTIQFDVPLPTPYYVWPLDQNFVGANVVLSSIINSETTWLNGQDFFIQNGSIWFRRNPFNALGVVNEAIYEDGVVVDWQCAVWLYRGEYDWQTTYKQFGYAVDILAKSGVNYRDLINAFYDAIVNGSTELSIKQAFAAICDVPVAKGAEVVESVTQDSRSLWVVTDQNVYPFLPGSTPVVGAGDSVQAGDPLVDTVQFFEFGRGQVPDEIQALAVGKGFLGTGFYQDLVFENKEVPLVVDATGEYTRVSFELGGMPSDVDEFWDQVHAKGVAADETLAMLMDQRPPGARDTQPGPQALPQTINPLGFLLQNVFRNNLFVVKLQTDLFGPNALGLHNGRILRDLTPPHTACIVLMELTQKDQIVMDGPGDSTRAGYEESMSTFPCSNFADSIDPTVMISERVRVYQIGGQCQ